MRDLLAKHAPLPGLGMTALVLGVIGLMLFFLPILGIPISALGLLFGAAGLVAAVFRWGDASLRWSVAGVVLCGMALGVNLVLNHSPAGYEPSRASGRAGSPFPTARTSRRRPASRAGQTGCKT